MIGEWEPESNGILTMPQDNKITGYVVNRLHNMCYPVEPGAPVPIFPNFPLKTLIIGKPFSGKTSALLSLQQGFCLFLLFFGRRIKKHKTDLFPRFGNKCHRSDRARQ
jgi:hypothetical protein